MPVVLAGLLGAAVGSFANVVVHRLPLGQSVVRPRSRCPECGHEVRSRDNVPVLSWVLLGGRCRDCGAVIAWRYPLLEALMALVYVGLVLRFGFGPELALQLPFVTVVLIIAFIDLDTQLIPNKLVVPLAVWGVLGTALLAWPELPERLIAGAGAFLFLLVVALVYPGGMGMGDVKLAGAMGLFLGLSVVPALLAAFLAGSLVGVYLLIRDGASARKQKVPFGPFLALGALVGVFAGPELIALYADRFLA